MRKSFICTLFQDLCILVQILVPSCQVRVRVRVSANLVLALAGVAQVQQLAKKRSILIHCHCCLNPGTTLISLPTSACSLRAQRLKGKVWPAHQSSVLIKVDLELVVFHGSPADIGTAERLSSGCQIHNNTLTPPTTKRQPTQVNKCRQKILSATPPPPPPIPSSIGRE